jgi:PAS domain S-box-containing protein
LVQVRTRQRESVAFLLALGMLAAVAALAYGNIDAATDTLGRVERGNQALREIEELNATYSRAASARRAYIVAADTSQLGDKADLDARVRVAIEALRVSLADSPSQLGRLDSWVELIEQRLASLDAAVEEKRLGGSGAENRAGLELATRLRATREGMEAAENQVLAERDAVTRRNLARTELAEVIGTLASFAVLVYAFGRLRQEVSRRHRSEQALQQGERFLDSIVENIPFMIFVKDAAELRFERINRAGEDLLGLDRKALLHKNDFDFFPPEQAEFFQTRDRETLSHGISLDIPEEPIQTKSGARWLHTKKVPILDHGGAPRYLLGISEDITERREAAVALHRAKEAAEMANRELEAFSYAVAHDLRAPLRAINGFSAALVEELGGRLEGESKECLERIGAGAAHMGELIDALLGLSRVSRTELTRESVDITLAAQTIIAQLRAEDSSRQVEFTVEEGMVDHADSGLIRVLLQNLLGNSWKFASKCENARIELGRAQNGDGVSYFVRDNGAGFDMAYAQKLFTPFQRLHSTNEFSGTGIGLATVQRIVRRHGGKVWAEGVVGQGATFHFTLQAASQPERGLDGR